MSEKKSKQNKVQQKNIIQRDTEKEEKEIKSKEQNEKKKGKAKKKSGKDQLDENGQKKSLNQKIQSVKSGIKSTVVFNQIKNQANQQQDDENTMSKAAKHRASIRDNEIAVFKKEVKDLSDKQIQIQIKIPSYIVPMYPSKFIPQSQPPSPRINKMQDILESADQMKSSFQNILVSNKNGMKARILDNVMIILQSGVQIDENLLKKINIFRLSEVELRDMKDRLVNIQKNQIESNRDNAESISETITAMINNENFQHNFSDQLCLPKNISYNNVMINKDEDQQNANQKNTQDDDEQEIENRKAFILAEKLKNEERKRINMIFLQRDQYADKRAKQDELLKSQNNTQKNVLDTQKNLTLNQIHFSKNPYHFEYLIDKMQQLKFLKIKNPPLYQNLLFQLRQLTDLSIFNH